MGGGTTSIYQTLKRAITRKPLNTNKSGPTTLLSSERRTSRSGANDLTLGDFQLPDQEICDSCKTSKERCTFGELQLLRETCDRRNIDGNQCIIPISIAEPDEQSRALERALVRVLPTAQLRERLSRYIFVRCDSRSESNNRATYTPVRYDSISRSPSPLSPRSSRDSMVLNQPLRRTRYRTPSPGPSTIPRVRLDSGSDRARGRSLSTVEVNTPTAL